jgi:hypothetical protein
MLTSDLSFGTVGNGATSTNIPSGLGGASTGTVISFQVGSTRGPPSSSVIIPGSSLTGAALSQEIASLSMGSQHNLGSMNKYTSTTGGAISGISTGIPGGYNEPTPASATSSPTQSSASQSDSASTFTSSANVLLWTLSTVAFLLGALIVL